jgi:hypothetical protein
MALRTEGGITQTRATRGKTFATAITTTIAHAIT